jgi:hypothetical protein
MSSIVLCSLGNNNANNDTNNNEEEETFPIPTIYRYVTPHILYSFGGGGYEYALKRGFGCSSRQFWADQRITSLHGCAV